jgi:glycosyltransferase involved in cell wall biosynthesis
VADRVVFTGHVDDPAELYRSFDLFALSSDTEQMPLCVLEAMATGLPIAATDVGDIRDMVAPCNRGSLATRDDAALAHAIRSLLRAPDRGRGIGAANRAKAERAYDQEIMFGSYSALLDGTSRPMPPI